jgi:hypothetical protein
MKKLIPFVFLSVVFLASNATAVTINGGASLLDNSRGSQLQTWLGEGEIILTDFL